VGNTSVPLTSVTTASGKPAQSLCRYEVIYKFSGFVTPVANDSVNSASPGQGVAVKWRITDYNGVPVTNDSTFVEVDTSLPKSGTCDTVPEFAVQDEQFKGGSNLQNLGGGNFQFNWATLKTYSTQCRTMSLRLAASGLNGPLPIPNTNPPVIPAPSRRYEFANFLFKSK
jgi:hypothetical protein